MRSRRNHLRKGAELLEFTFVLLPLLAMIWTIMDIGWAVFAKSTLQRAVRTGVRTGVTITAAQATAAGTCLTEMVKSAVQQNSLGLLSGATGRARSGSTTFNPRIRIVRQAPRTSPLCPAAINRETSCR